jgi:hypothetical protein
MVQLNEGIAQPPSELNVSYLDPGRVFPDAEDKYDQSLFSDGLHCHPESSGSFPVYSFLFS